MSRPWFYAEPDAWADGTVRLSPEESRHASRSLRIRPGDEIVVTDGLGRRATGIAGGASEALEVNVEHEERLSAPEPRLVVYQAASKGSKLDSVVERLAELGVAELYSFSSARSIVDWDGAKIAKLNERWAAIARSAAKQSRNPHFLRARAGLSWDEAVTKVGDEQFAVCLWEEASLPMRAALVEEVSSVAIVVGPEGGFTREEAEALADAGAPSVSLGDRILRTENAALVAASALMYHYGTLA